jgi:hemoglobin
MPTQQKTQTLNDRLGGVYSIAVVVDDFIDRIMVNPWLNANPAINEAHHKVPPPGFKYLVSEMVRWAAGGPHNTQDAPWVTPIDTSISRPKNGKPS